MSRLHVLGSASVTLKPDVVVDIVVTPDAIVTMTIGPDDAGNRPVKLYVAFLPPNFGPGSLDAGTMLSTYKNAGVMVPAAVAGQPTILKTTMTDINPGDYTAVAIGEFLSHDDHDDVVLIGP